MTTVLLVALAIVAAAVVTGLAAPLHVRVHLATDPAAGEPAVRVRLRWLFLGWDTARPPRRAAPAPPAPPAPSEPGPPESPATGRRTRRGRRPSRASRRVLAALARADFRARVGRLLRDLLRIVRPTHARLRARVGLDDPASTGALAGMLYGLSAALPHAAPAWDVHVDLAPEFLEPTVEARADVEWSVSAGAALWPLVTFLASPVTWRTFLATRPGRPGPRAA